MQYSIILKALVESIGGNGDEFENELDALIKDYPNCLLLIADIMRNGANLSKEVEELHNKVELLKNCLVENKMLIQVPAPEGYDPRSSNRMTAEQIQAHVESFISEQEPEKDEEIKIDNIVWHMACDEDMPN